MTQSSLREWPSEAARRAGGRPSHSPGKAAVASLIGTSLEFYDHFIFGIAALFVFPRLFFPSDDPRTATLMSLIAYAIAFAARPLGAALFGHLGDRLGRKRCLVLTLLLMGTATVLIGLLPGYERIGWAAPIMLAMLRFAQGLALGGEWGGAALMVFETAKGRKGLLGSVVQVASPIGFLLANLAFAGLTAALPDQAFFAWGWRIPFLSSALLVCAGLYVRASLHETPAFEAMRTTRRAPPAPPLGILLRHHWGKLAIACGARAGSDVAWYVFSLFLTVYLARIGVARSVALEAGIMAACVQLAAIPLFGHLSDRWGSRPCLIAGALLGSVWAFAFFQLVDTKVPQLIVLACVIGMVIQAALWAPLASFLPEMFPTEIRFTGAGLGFQLAGIVGGALAPIVTLGLLDRFGSSRAIAVYVAASLAVIILAVTVSGAQARRARLSA